MNNLYGGIIMYKSLIEADVLVSEEQLAKRVAKLGKTITKDYKGKDLLVIGVLKGACIFMSDLIRNIDNDMMIDFIAVSSYGNSTKSSGAVRFNKDLDYSIEGKHVLIVEDIIDTGLTLSYLNDNFLSRKCASVEIATLLDKPERRKADISVKYVGFQIPDVYIVGYGLDFAEKYRHLPYIGTLKEEAYK